jgi:ACS family hexuronate transporter-like MFS transporter
MPSELTQTTPSNDAAAQATEPLPLDSMGGGGGMTRFRWTILVLAFAGTTICYVDRQVMNILGPFLSEKYGITDVQWGNIGSAFAWSYAIGQMISGGLLDRVGVRIGYPLGLFLWSIVSILHAFAIGLGGALVPMLGTLGASVGGAALGFGVMRACLGLSEAPNFPAVTKAISEWFPKKERAFAMGFINAGTNIGILIALLLVEPITLRHGWQWAFVITGSLGLLWLVFWLPTYRPPQEHPHVSAAELNYIRSDPGETSLKIPWSTLLSYRQAWSFTLAKFLTDAMWWFYMVWFAKFLAAKYHMNLSTIGLPLIVVFLMADVGSIGGGWLSSVMIKRGASINLGRKTALLVCALMVVPIMFAAYPDNAWISVVLLGLATAGHQGFSSNIYAMVSDMFPRQAVASVAGLGGTFGYVGAAMFSSITGYLVDRRGNYVIPFIVAGSAYLISLAIIHILAPRLEPAAIEGKEGHGFPVITKP